MRSSYAVIRPSLIALPRFLDRGRSLGKENGEGASGVDVLENDFQNHHQRDGEDHPDDAPDPEREGR